MNCSETNEALRLNVNMPYFLPFFRKKPSLSVKCKVEDLRPTMYKNNQIRAVLKSIVISKKRILILIFNNWYESFRHTFVYLKLNSYLLKVHSCKRTHHNLQNINVACIRSSVAWNMTALSTTKRWQIPSWHAPRKS
jgi:hypothetical protein